MSKLSNFLHLKIYRRTFLVYAVIVLIFITVIICMFYNNVQASGLNAYASQAEASFDRAERQLTSITDSIDNFFTHLYGNSPLLEDFFHFFGATPVEYAESSLDSAYPQYETYLTSCNNLISDSNYSIRHILYYSTFHIVDMEYSSSGYSRYRIIDQDAAEALCKSGYLYTKDIHQGSAYVGKVSFIIDISTPIVSAFCADGSSTVFLILGGSCTPLGNTQYQDVDWEQLLRSGSRLGQTGAPSGMHKKLMYFVQASDRFSYTVIALAPARPYLVQHLNEFLLLCFALVLVFTLITCLYVRQFSKDAQFIRSILHSMVEAQSSNFEPVDIGDRQDEFADIAGHLNSLYQYLDTLIQQKYMLTIRQQRTEMQMLTAQLNPHFLYNTLERIRLRALTEGCPTVAEATADLGQLYRSIVKTEAIITIEKELDITKQYLDLMCFLYDDQFLYHCDIPDSITSISTPKIWMQPIVENFFKHNFQRDDQLKVIVISGEVRSDSILFQFFDNIGHISDEQILALNRQFTPEPRQQPAGAANGMGLQNVYDRLRLYYGKRLEMHIQNNKPAGVCIQILLKNEVKS